MIHTHYHENNMLMIKQCLILNNLFENVEASNFLKNSNMKSTIYEKQNTMWQFQRTNKKQESHDT